MFKGLGNLGNIASMMGSLQKLPEKMQQLNERMKSETVSATSTDSLVVVVMNGVGEVQSIDINSELQGENLNASVVEATNVAGKAAKQLYADGIGQMVEEMDLHIPGLDGILTHLTGG